MLHEGKLQAVLSWMSPRLGLEETPRIAAEVDHQSDGAADSNTGEICILEVGGTLANRGAHADGYSGLTSYEWIGRMISAAVKTESVKGILIKFDSYGGEVSGVFDCADLIARAAEVKPTWAMVDDNCYSAAYLLASQCNRILTTRTGGCGSIGVIAVHMDQSKYDDKIGVKYTPVYAGSHKNDFSPHQAIKDGPLAWLTSEVERDYDLFCEYVSRGRGMGVDVIRATEAGLFVGEDAISAGLADGIATREEALSMLIEQTSKIGGSAAKNPKRGVSMQQHEAAAESPKRTADSEYCDDCPNKGMNAESLRSAGAATERGRIAAILNLEEANGREKLARAIAFDTNSDAETAKKLLAVAPKEQQKTANPLAEAMAAESNPSVGVAGSTGHDDNALVQQILNAGRVPQKEVN